MGGGGGGQLWEHQNRPGKVGLRARQSLADVVNKVETNGNRPKFWKISKISEKYAVKPRNHSL